ncbi:hypothetical protein DAEQUDRAFT_762436 [Daedalea quercina L-15889]|uniref:WD40 repeat-like protein n=1 Tax=Daedalea quercina L-15889 TaxID=1314783 RepID=A0A165T8J8_9APHY|nr:hypothetical protein DAEQUDRAFT_762436 [Daedalea quercina L-15889]
MSRWIDQLGTLSEKLGTIGDIDEDGDDDMQDDDRSERKYESDKKLLDDTLRQVCEVVRNASTEGAGELEQISDGMYDFMPSFAHGNEESLKAMDSESFLVFFKDYLDPNVSRNTIRAAGGASGPWNTGTQPHAKSICLSRFRQRLTTSATDATPLAQAVYQARCEITDDRIPVPSKMLISSGQSCLAVIGAGGWKNRDPMLQCYLLGHDNPLDQRMCFSPGLSEVAYTLATDEDRKLVFAADSDRVKSYSAHPGLPGVLWGPVRPSRRADYPRGAWQGARVEYRLPQHGPRGKRIDKGKYNTENSMRDNDDGEEIEASTGNTPFTVIEFADATLNPAVWHRHAPTGNMLCGTNGRRSGVYVCVSVDLENGGRYAARYLGHGRDVEDISTSEGDPNAFATAGSGGYARLYDLRQPLPVVTFDQGHQLEYCPAAVLVHPDGVPTLFTAGMRSEQIKMWDIRAKATVYELSTGNNAVATMAWDSKRSVLYAATECEYMDRMGYHHDYRAARIPKWADGKQGYKAEERPDEDDDDEDMDDNEEEEEEEDEFGRCWPEKAHRGESHFGYAFDVGDHRIYRYAFKEDPDTTKLPTYGDASTRQSHW